MNQIPDVTSIVLKIEQNQRDLLQEHRLLRAELQAAREQDGRIVQLMEEANEFRRLSVEQKKVLAGSALRKYVQITLTNYGVRCRS